MEEIINKKESIFSLSLLHELIIRNTSNNNICICYPSLFFIYCYIYLHSFNPTLKKQISSQILKNSKEGEINTMEHDIIKEINENQFTHTISSSFSYTEQLTISFMLRNFSFPLLSSNNDEILDRKFNKHKFNDVFSMNVNKNKDKSHVSFINEKLHSLSLNANNANDAIKKIEKSNLSSFVYLQASFPSQLSTITTKQGITLIRDKVKCRYLKDEKKKVVVLDTQSNFELVLIKSKQKGNDKNIIESLVNANNQYTKEEINLTIPCFSINVVNDINEITSLVYNIFLDSQFNNVIQVITLELNKYGLNVTKDKKRKEIVRNEKEKEEMQEVEEEEEEELIVVEEEEEEEEENKRGKKVKNSSSQSSFRSTINNNNNNIMFTNNFYLFVCEKSQKILEKPILSVYIANHSNLSFNNLNLNEDKIIKTTYSSFYHSPIMIRNIFNILKPQSNYSPSLIINNEFNNNFFIDTIEITPVNKNNNNNKKIFTILAISNISSLKKFTIVGKNNYLFDDKYINDICIALNNNNNNIKSTLKYIKIYKVYGNNNYLLLLFKSFFECIELQELILRKTNLSQLFYCSKTLQHLSMIEIFLNNKTKLRILNISDNINFNNTIFNSSIFINSSSLKEIYFNNNNITDISRFQCHSAHTVSLDNNKIGFLGLFRITNNKFPLLSTLTINNCNINNDQFIGESNQFIEEINQFNIPNSLSTISANDNKINNNLLLVLINNIIHSNIYLSSLSLSNNDLNNKDLISLVKIPSNKLKYLNLSNNNKINSILELIKFLKNNKVLENLDISSIKISASDFKLLMSTIIPSNIKILSIDIKTIKNSKLMIKSLFNFLYSNYSIVSIGRGLTLDDKEELIKNTFLNINQLLSFDDKIDDILIINLFSSLNGLFNKEFTKKVINFACMILSISPETLIPINIMKIIISYINYKKFINEYYYPELNNTI